MSQIGRPLLRNVYNQNAYFSGNGVRASLVATALKVLPLTRTYETQDETLGEEVFYTVRLRVIRDRVDKSLETGTVKYGREIQGTRIRERLRWRGPAAYTKHRPVLSSEWAPHKTKTVTVKQ
jgi:hypothetical protein